MALVTFAWLRYGQIHVRVDGNVDTDTDDGEIIHATEALLIYNPHEEI